MSDGFFGVRKTVWIVGALSMLLAFGAASSLAAPAVWLGVPLGVFATGIYRHTEPPIRLLDAWPAPAIMAGPLTLLLPDAPWWVLMLLTAQIGMFWNPNWIIPCATLERVTQRAQELGLHIRERGIGLDSIALGRLSNTQNQNEIVFLGTLSRGVSDDNRHVFSSVLAQPYAQPVYVRFPNSDPAAPERHVIWSWPKSAHARLAQAAAQRRPTTHTPQVHP